MSFSSGGRQRALLVFLQFLVLLYIPIAFATTNALLFVLSFMFEGLMSFRARLDSHMVQDCSKYRDKTNQIGPFTFPENFVRSVLHAFSYFASQVLMMIFMAYNGYFCASLVLGRFFGYFFFALFLPEYRIGERPKSCCG